MHRQTATDPGSPAGCLRFAKVTVASNIISAIEDLRARRITQLETIAVNSTVGEGAVWHVERCDGPVTVSPSATLTFRGMIQAPPQCWIFADSGAVDFSGYVGQVDVRWFGAVPDGVTDSTTRLKRWIDSGAREMYFSGGAYVATTNQLVIDYTTVLTGAGENTQLLTPSTGGNLIDITTTGSVTLKGFVIGYTCTPTGGYAIRLAATPTSNVGSRFEDLRIQGPWIGFGNQTGVFFAWTHNTISSPRLAGIEIQNTINPDQGDSTISENIFVLDINNSAGIVQYNAGGIRCTDNKFLYSGGTGQIGYLYDIAGGDTSLLTIANNNFDGIRTGGYGVLFRQTSSVFSMIHIVINGNIFTFNPEAGAARGVTVDASASTRLSQMLIHNNHFRPSLDDVPIDLAGGRSISIMANHFDSVDALGQFAVIVGAAAADITVGLNHVRNISQVTAMSFSSATTTIVFPDVRGVPIAKLGAIGNGSITHCYDCSTTDPCTGAGAGALAHRRNGMWSCQ